MRKRQKFLLVSFLLSLGLLATQLVQIDYRYHAITVLGFLAYGLSAWALFDDLKGVEWFSILILPVLYSVSVALFYFLLPEKLLSRLFILGLFGVGMYAMLLTENIFSVAAIRTIQLLRAAHAVGFLITLATAFFLYDTILSFRFSFWLNFLLVFIVSLPLLLQGLWSIELDENRLSKRVFLNSLFISLGLGELALAISFWPVSIPVGSLFLVSTIYVALGISQQHFLERLFEKTLYEYLSVGIVVLMTILVFTQWG